MLLSISWLRSPILRYWQSEINSMVALYDKFSMMWWFMINQFHNSSRRVLWCAFLRSKEIIPTLWVYVCGLNKVYVVLDAHITHSHIGYHLHSTHFRTKKSIFQKKTASSSIFQQIKRMLILSWKSVDKEKLNIPFMKLKNNFQNGFQPIGGVFCINDGWNFGVNWSCQ